MKKIKIKCDEYEFGLIIRALNEYRKNQKQETEENVFTTEVLQKLLEKVN